MPLKGLFSQRNTAVRRRRQKKLKKKTKETKKERNI